MTSVSIREQIVYVFICYAILGKVMNNSEIHLFIDLLTDFLFPFSEMLEPLL